MRVLKKIKNESGEYLIDCEFNDVEFNLILEVGLNELLKMGAIPFTLINKQEASKYAPGGQA